MTYNDSIINAYRNRGYRIYFYQGGLGNLSSVGFDAYITAFSDSYEPVWEDLPQFIGQQDKFKTATLTTRNISISFDIPSASLEESETNLSKVKTLMSFLYPLTNGGLTTSAIIGPPEIYVKFLNWISDYDGSAIRAIITEAAVDPVVEHGFFDPGPGQLYPKTLKCDISFLTLTNDPDPASRI